MDEMDSARALLAVRRVVWLSFVLALVAYGIVGKFMFADASRPVDMPAWLLPVVAVVLGMGSLFVPRVLGRESSASLGASPSSGSPAARPTLPTSDLLTWAMAEGVGITGLVALVLGGTMRGLVIYLAAALVLLVLQRPTE